MSCSRGKESISHTHGYVNQVARLLSAGEKDLHTVHRKAAAWLKSGLVPKIAKDIPKVTPEWRENLVRGKLILAPSSVTF